MYLPPYLASLVFGWSLVGGPTADLSPKNTIDFAALATIFAGVFLVAKYRSALEVSQSAAEAWKLERDAEKAKGERLSFDLAKETARVAALEQRPDLTKMEGLLSDLVAGQNDILAALHTQNVRAPE